MTRTHALLAMAGLLTTTALMLRPPRAEPERVEERAPTPPLAAPTRPVKLAPAGPLDGVYVLGGGRTLTLTHGRFVLENHGASPAEVVRGVAKVKGETLELRSGLLLLECRFAVAADHLLLNQDERCHLLARRRDATREAPEGLLDLGEVGLRPFPGASGVGFWLDDRGGRVEMRDEPEPVRDPFSNHDAAANAMHWDPDEFGLVSEFLPTFEHINLVTTDLHVFWVMTGADTARWVSTGGWGYDEHEIAVRSFRRVSRAEYEAAGRRELESLRPPAPSTPPAE